MPINFPNNPSLNDTFVINDITYTWNGTSWISVIHITTDPTDPEFGYIGGATMSPVGIETPAVAHPGRFNASGEVSYNWSWFVNGVDQGVNANTFTPSEEQAGLELSCQIEVTDNNGIDIISLGPSFITYIGWLLTTDYYTAEQGETVYTTPLDNDNFPVGSPEGTTMQVTAATVNPAEGTVIITDDGTRVVFLPNPSVYGEITINYTVTTSTDETNDGIIKVTVNQYVPPSNTTGNPPNPLTAPTIPTGDFYIGYSLPISGDTWSNDPNTFQISWYRDNTKITQNLYAPESPSLNDRIYYPSFRDFGKELIAKVAGVNEFGTSTEIASNSTDGVGIYKIDGIKPYFPIEVARHINLNGGEPFAQGRMLTVNEAQWTEIPESVTRTWFRDGVEIIGETGTDYIPTADDVGAIISVTETATLFDATTSSSTWTASSVISDHRIMEWGSLTRPGYGDFLMTDYDGNPLTNVTRTDGTLPEMLFEIVYHINDPDSDGDRYKVTGFYVRNLLDQGMTGTDGQTIIVSSDQGNFTFRVHELTNGQSFYPQWPYFKWQINDLQKLEETWRSELYNILGVETNSAEDLALEGQTLYGRHGIQGINDRGFDEYPLGPRTVNDYTTIQSHDFPRRPNPGESVLVLKIHIGNSTWSATWRKFKRVHWVSEYHKIITDDTDPNYDNRELNGETFYSRSNSRDNFARTYVNSGGGSVTPNGSYGWLWWDECDIDGEWRKHAETYGSPPFNGDYTYAGFIKPVNGSIPQGPLTITKCSIHDYWRGMVLPIIIPGVTISDTDFHHCAVDSLIVTHGTPNRESPIIPPHHITRNRWFEQIDNLPPEMNVISFDHTTNIIVVEDPEQWLDGGPTMNWTENTGSFPTGTTKNTDMNTDFISHDPVTGYTTLQISTGILMTDNGVDLKIRIEPSHTDYVQGIIGQHDAYDILLYNNVIYGYPESTVPAEYDWPQGFFFEDIGNAISNNNYRRCMISGNLIYTAKTLHGISLYNPLECVVAENTIVTPDSNVVPYIGATFQPTSGSYVAQVGMRKNWFGFGAKNLMYGNLSGRIYNYWEEMLGDQREVTVRTGDLQNKTVDPDILANTGLLKLTNGRNPSTFEDALMSFRRNDQIGVADYQRRYFDLPSTNEVTMPALQDVPLAETGVMQVHAPILMDGIFDTAGNLSRYGALVYMPPSGFDTGFRISNDETATDIVHDWGTDPQFIQNGQYLWIRSRASGNPGVTTEPLVWVGGQSLTWKITSSGLDVAAPTITNVDVYNRSADDALINFSTDENTGQVYWVVDQTPTRTFEEMKLINQYIVPQQVGEQINPIKVQQLAPDTTYFAHVAQEDASGNQSVVTTVEFKTTGEVVFFDTFDTDTRSNYSIKSGSMNWNSEMEVIEYVCGNTSWDGPQPVEGIVIPRAGTWHIEALVSNENVLSSVDMLLETGNGTPTTLAGTKTSEIAYSTMFKTLHVSVVTTGPTTIWPRIRFRGSANGSVFLLFNLQVTESNPYNQVINRSTFGKMWDNPVVNIPYFEDFSQDPFNHTNPADDWIPEGSALALWKSYQTELVFTHRFNSVLFSSPEITVMPYEYYRIEMVVQHLSDVGGTQMRVGRRPLVGDIIVSYDSYTASTTKEAGGWGLISEVIRSTPRATLAVMSEITSHTDSPGARTIIHGVRISLESENLPPLTLEDVKQNAIQPPAIIDPSILYNDDLTSDQSASYDVSLPGFPSEGSIVYDTEKLIYIVSQGGPWQQMSSPEINVVIDGSHYYRAWAVVDNREEVGQIELNITRGGASFEGIIEETSNIRTSGQLRQQKSVIINPNDSIIRVTPRARGGDSSLKFGVARLILEEFNPFETRQWPLWMEVFPNSTGLFQDSWTLDLMRDPDRNEENYNIDYTTDIRHNTMLSINAGGKTRSQMKSELLAGLDTMVTDGWLSSYQDNGDHIIITEDSNNPLLEPRFFYKHKLPGWV